MKREYGIKIREFDKYGSIIKNEIVYRNTDLYETYKEIHKRYVDEENKLINKLGCPSYMVKTEDFERERGSIAYMVYKDDCESLSNIYIELIETTNLHREIKSEDIEKVLPKQSKELRCNDCHKVITARESEDYGGCCEKCHRFYAD